MQINVKGGTNAGWRRISGPIKPWTCPNCHKNVRFTRYCYECGTKNEE